MSGVFRGQKDRRRDQLGLHSSAQHSRSSSQQPPPRDESPAFNDGAVGQPSEAALTAADSLHPFIAMQVSAPRRGPSPAYTAPIPSKSQQSLGGIPGPVNHLAIVNNNTSNVNHVASGGTIVNNINNFTQVIPPDIYDADLDVVEKALGQLHVSRALYDAQPLTAGCMEDTRVQLLKDVQSLLTSNGGPHIVWIAGMAGTGKTSIALTLCRMLSGEATVLLGGTFFCSRSAGMIDRTDPRRIIPTLVILLARQIPQYAQAVAAVLKKDPDIASKAVNFQVKRLLLQPLKRVGTMDQQIVFVIDALDECSDQAGVAELIDALADFKTTPLNDSRAQAKLGELIEVLARFRTISLNERDNRTRLVTLIDGLAALRRIRLDDQDDQSVLKDIITALLVIRNTYLNDLDKPTKLADHIGALVNFKNSRMDIYGDRADMKKLMDVITHLGTMRLDERDNRDRLVELVDVLAGLNTTSLDDRDDQARLKFLITALVDFRRMYLDDLSNQARLVALVDSLANFKTPPSVKFLLTSRPEMHIRETAITDKSLSSIVQLHMVDVDQVTSDIRLYIQRTFQKSSKSPSWYTDDDIDKIAALSAGLFIFASTVLAYILRRKDGPGRSDRLRTVKQQSSASSIATDPLDQMYSLVLMQASDPDAFEETEIDEMHRIIAIILSTRSPLTVKELAELLGTSADHVRGVLAELHAVILVPDQDEEGELRTLHASFGDFIFARAAPHIRVEKSLGHRELAQACLQRMNAEDLCFNVSRGQSSYQPNGGTASIPRSLVYACLHWGHHVALAAAGSLFGEMINSLLRLKLLFWLEVLSVTGEVDRAQEFLLAIKEVTSPDASRFFRDAYSFVTSSHEAIGRSAPHIYLSALAFAPKKSLVYQMFYPRLTGVLRVKAFRVCGTPPERIPRVSDAVEDSSHDLQIDEYAGEVCSTAVGRHGRFIASASADGWVRVWDSQSRQQMYPPLTGHNGPVYSVALSLDNRRIVTGSQDGTIRLWKARTGHSAMPELRGHADIVNAVSFSPDGLYIASGSDDRTVRFWEVASGQPAGIEQLRCGVPVRALAYSPSGESIAICDHLGDIRIYSTATGQEAQIFQRPNASQASRVLPARELKFHSSLAFSPDGTKIAAISSAGIAELHVRTGHRLVVVQSHYCEMTAVAYSPDGQVIAAGSDDGTVRLWNIEMHGRVRQKLSGHIGAISSIVFSSNGRFLVTGSWDKTIRRWDIEKIRSLAEQRGQSSLTSLSFASYEKDQFSGHPTGWLISSSGQLLLWVPPEYRGHLEIGDHSHVIAAYRVVATAEDDVLHQGDQWTRCWRT